MTSQPPSRIVPLMDLRPLSETVAAAPMLEPTDMAALAAEGVTTIICNRPDAEVPPSHQADAMRAAVEAAGMRFVENPVSMPQLTLSAIDAQRAAIAEAPGPVVAYCASGTRSAVLWALSMAGQMPSEEILASLAQAGYPMPQLAGQIDALAEGA